MTLYTDMASRRPDPALDADGTDWGDPLWPLVAPAGWFDDDRFADDTDCVRAPHEVLVECLGRTVELWPYLRCVSDWLFDLHCLSCYWVRWKVEGVEHAVEVLRSHEPTVDPGCVQAALEEHRRVAQRRHDEWLARETG